MGPEAALRLLAVAVLLSSTATPCLRPHLGIGVGVQAADGASQVRCFK